MSILQPRVPDACPVCNTLIRSLDIEPYARYECCSKCELKWAQLNQEEWHAGWRPAPEEVSEEIKRRKEEPYFFSRLIYLDSVQDNKEAK